MIKTWVSREDFFRAVVCLLFFLSLLYFFCQLFLQYRRRRVNIECWFCRGRSLVDVANRNSFTCNNCSQYNGFTKSGDYNRLIPAHFDVNLNPPAFLLRQPASFASKSDILCPQCSHNQEMKITKLSDFEASSEPMWDHEMEAFQHELEYQYPLCTGCSTKVLSRITKVDSKVLPSLLSWWRNKDRDHVRGNTEFVKNRNTEHTYPVILSRVLRPSTCLAWCVLVCGPLFHALVFYACEPHSYSNPSVLSGSGLHERIIRRLAQKISICHCQTLLVPVSWTNLSTEYVHWILVICFFSHLTLLLLHSLRPYSSPLVFLVDAIFLVLSAKFIANSSLPLRSLLEPCILGFAVICSACVLIYKWFPYAREDLIEQKKKLSATWPHYASICPPSGSPPSYFSSTPSQSPLNALQLDRLSLNCGRTPPLRSPPCYSAIFSPPTLRSSFGRSAGQPLTCYAASAAPAFDTAYRYRKLSDDALSHFTSVSQLGDTRRRGQEREDSQPELKKRSRRSRRSRQPGLLRWTLYLLFGRLDTWEDVKAELICLLNAVLVGVLLLLIGHIFYTIVPPLWQIQG